MILQVFAADVGPFHGERTLSADLSASTVCVVGDNGSGKTTLVNVLAYLLSGDPAWVRGASSLEAGDQVDPSASCVVTPSPADGIMYTVGRSIPSRRKAWRKIEGNGRRLTTEVGVTTELESWFGMPPRAFAEYSFVPQGEMADIVSADPAVRRKAIGKFLGLDHAEKVWEALGQEAKVVPVGGDVLAHLRARAAASAGRVVAAREARTACGPVDEEEVVRAVRRSGHLEAQAMASASRVSVERALEQAARRRDAATQKAEDCRRRVAERMADVDEYWKLCKLATARSEYVRLVQSVKHCTASLADIELVDPGPEPVEHPAVAAARVESGTWERIVALKPGEACPACFRAVDEDLARLIEETRTKLEAFREADREWQAYKQRYDKAQAVYRSRRQTRDYLEGNRAASQAALAAIPDEVKAADYDARFSTLGVIHSAYLTDAAGVRLAEEEARSAGAEAATHEQTLKAMPATPDQAVVAAARDAAAALQDRLNLATSLEADLAAAEAAYRSDREAVEAAEASDRATAARVEWSGRAARVREVFHRDAAPAALVTEYVADLESELNEWLERFQAPFRARVTEDCGFTAHFADGSVPIPVERLSGGQQLVLAWAWVSARQSRHGERLWLLCLDEPTYGLDEVRSRALRDVVDGWRSGLPGRQLLVVTHDRRLASAFDRVVALA